MSNALSLIHPAAWNAISLLAVADTATSAPATPAGNQVSYPLWLLATGLLVLLFWIIGIILQPDKIKLSPAPWRPNTLTPLHIVMVYILWIGSSAGALALLQMYHGLPVESMEVTRESSPILVMKMTVLASASAQVFMLVGSLVVATWTFGLGIRRGFGLSMRHWLCDGIRGLTGVLAIIPICVALMFVGQWLLPISKHPLIVAIGSLGAAWKVLLAFSAIVLAPLAEEVFFRGLIQSMVRRYLGSPWAAITITSLFFAAVHTDTPQNIPALFALSLMLGYVYERSGRLVSSILIHAIFNAVNIALVL